ncbi:MAG: MFS transporter [Candidatus Microbacterium phytovorans]|uniref:MFS transporter n=1 Tax=Candidatus Microbacterium phytovorans TaxID=3121374 RepID=A0AAJ5W092_9MICO|nr:MFS transporter [Microbacterium sp.]WEK13362.1 MAG: MFS transporter [Microbacterium sp.]
MSDAAPPTSPVLTRGTIARYAIGSIGTGGFATLPGLVLTYYLTDSLGVTALLAGIIVTVAKVWDVLIDPVVGAWSDRDLARHGSRRRLMLLGAVAIPVLFALTFAVPPGMPAAVGAVWVLIAFVATATAFSLFQVPYIALPAELTDGYDARTRLLTWRVVVLTVAILLFGAGGPVLRRVTGDPTSGYLVMGIVAGVVIGAGMLVATTVVSRSSRSRSAMAAAGTSAAEAAELLAVSVGEEPHRPVGADASTPGGGVRDNFRAAAETLRRSRPFRALLATFFLQALATGLMLAGAQYLATWVLRSEDAVTLLFVALIAPALLAAPAWGVAARRLGKERAFAGASVVFAVAALSTAGALWAPGAWLYASVAVAGIAYAGMQSLPMAMLPDVIAHDASRHGPGRAGAFGGVWTAGETTGFALGATALAVVLASTGYLERTAGVEVTQPASAVAGIVLSFSVAPAALVIASLVTLRGYGLRRGDIEARHS